MKTSNRFSTRLRFASIIAGGTVLGSAFSYLPDLFEVRKQQEILSAVFEEVNLEYVDEIDPAELMRKAAAGMLASLDPYTLYFSESEVTEARLREAEGLGSIGARLQQKGDQVIVADIEENGAARTAGLLPGDAIIAINGRSARGRSASQVEAFLEGQIGSDVLLRVGRQGKELEFRLSLGEISRSNLVWHGLVDDRTAYIKLGFFGPGAAREFREAFQELKQKGAARLVIDLRDNPGGILQEAVALCNIFVDRGELIVSTKGKKAENNRAFSTSEAALDTEIPLTVLLNSSSASASEIVAGALQDLDRALVVGQRSFGKGLVQVNKNLPYNAQVKITIAKYYIPSGRCIQALDYTHRNPDGSVGKVPDSLVSDFRTRNGRLVRDGGGILPDLEVEKPAPGQLVQTLLDRNLIFEYANQYREKHDSIAPAAEFRLSEADYKDFVSFLSGKDYSYTTGTEKILKTLREKAGEEQYLEVLGDELGRMENKLKQARKQDLDTHKETIMALLKAEIAERYYFQGGRLQASFADDPELQKALEVLGQPTQYAALLSGK